MEARQWIPTSEVERITGTPAPKAISEQEAATYLNSLMADIRTATQPRESAV